MADTPVSQRETFELQIKSLQGKLTKLDALIAKREDAVSPELRKAAARRNTSIKAKDKPSKVVEKVKIAHRNELIKSLSHEDSGKTASGSSAKSSESQTSVSDLRSLATRVRGQIAVAKHKLAALP